MKRFLTLLSFIAIAGISAPVLAQSPAPQGGRPAAQQQTGKLFGRLVDTKGQPVAYATITLLRSDSSVVNGDLTKDNGTFTIEPTGVGKFHLRISAIGFQQKIIDNIIITQDSPEKDLGKVQIGSSSTQLKEVQVTAEKPIMEMGIDKKTFNVEKNITTAGGSASDVLQNVPSVSVDVDGNVSLRGKGDVTILIDGKPATLLGGDAASALQSMPASSISSVEVITNPSAKYDAQGMTGIINIITKKDTKFGFNGLATIGAGTRDKYNGNINLNLRNKKWNIFANSSIRLNSNYNRTTSRLDQKMNDTSTYSYEQNQRKFNGWFNTLGADYTIDNNNSITFTQNINKMHFGGNGPAYYQLYDAGNMYLQQNRYSDRDGGPFSISSALDYKHKFHKEKQELTANGTYSKSWMTMSQTYVTDTFDHAENPISGKYYQNSPSSGSNSSFSGQVDFTTPLLTKNGKFDAGVKTQLFWFESSNNPTITSPDGTVKTDSVLLNGYRYSQKNYAAYVNFSDQIGKFGYQAGLRFEDAEYEGTTTQANGKTYTNKFPNFFPSAFLSYKLPQDQSVYLSYTRRINRPDFRQLMPYLDLSNPQEVSSGNPDLKPEFINNTELSYNKLFKKGHNFIASLYYQYTENLIAQYHYYDASTNITYVQPQNLNSGVTYGLELTGKAQILPIWDATLNFNFFQNKIMGDNVDPSLDNSGFSWLGKVNTNLKLPKGFSIQLNGNYESPKVSGQGHLEDAWWVDAAIKKNFWGGKANVVLNVSDIFNTRKYTTVYDLATYYQSIYRDRETRIGNLTFTYRFGKNTQSGGQRRKQNNQPQVKERDNLKSDDDNSGGGF